MTTTPTEAARGAALRDALLALEPMPDVPAEAWPWLSRLADLFLGSGLSPEALARMTRDDPDWEGFDRFVEAFVPWLRALCEALAARVPPEASTDA